MGKRLLRIIGFGVLGVSLHSVAIMAQEQGEDILIPVIKNESAAQDSINAADFGPENRHEVQINAAGTTKLLSPDFNKTSPEKSSDKKNDSTKAVKKEESQSNLSFNFLYYIFYKFKPSEVFEKK